MDYISNIFKLFDLNDVNRLHIKRGQKFIEVNPLIIDKPYILEFNGILDEKMEFSILTKEFKNIGGARYSEDDFEKMIKKGEYKPL